MKAGLEPHHHDSFGELLMRCRTAAGMTQEELAERAELSVRGLRYLEHGLRRPYRDTVERLVKALALPPQDYRTLMAAARPRSVPSPSRAERAGSGTLPVPPGPLIGRGREAGTAVNLLRREDVRLLTFTGSGGVGKTRLAIEVAGRFKHDVTDGVVWVPLAQLTDSSLVPSAIAQALGLMETARLRDASGTSSWPLVQQSRERWLAAAHETLGEDAFRTSWAKGQAMTPEHAIADALDEAVVMNLL